MDKTSKKIIKYLKSQPSNSLYYFDEPYISLDIDEDEFFRCVRYLEENNYVNFISNQNGHHLGIQLTHETVHAKEINRTAKFNFFKQWLIISYIGGIITGITTTLLSQFLINNGAELISKLFDLLKSQ